MESSESQMLRVQSDLGTEWSSDAIPTLNVALGAPKINSILLLPHHNFFSLFLESSKISYNIR